MDCRIVQQQQHCVRREATLASTAAVLAVFWGFSAAGAAVVCLLRWLQAAGSVALLGAMLARAGCCSRQKLQMVALVFSRVPAEMEASLV